MKTLDDICKEFSYESTFSLYVFTTNGIPISIRLTFESDTDAIEILATGIGIVNVEYVNEDNITVKVKRKDLVFNQSRGKLAKRMHDMYFYKEPDEFNKISMHMHGSIIRSTETAIEVGNIALSAVNMKELIRSAFRISYDFRKGVTRCLLSYEIFSLVSAFGIGWTVKDKTRFTNVCRNLFKDQDFICDSFSDHTIILIGHDLNKFSFSRRFVQRYISNKQFKSNKFNIGVMLIRKITSYNRSYYNPVDMNEKLKQCFESVDPTVTIIPIDKHKIFDESGFSDAPSSSKLVNDALTEITTTYIATNSFGTCRGTEKLIPVYIGTILNPRYHSATIVFDLSDTIIDECLYRNSADGIRLQHNFIGGGIYIPIPIKIGLNSTSTIIT